MSSGLVYAVDDEQESLEILRRTLEDTYEVRLFTTPAAALEAARATIPDVVILDYRMPEMNGVELLKALRLLDRTLPVIMTTAYADQKVDYTEQVRLLYRVLNKPFDPKTILNTVADGLRNRDLRRGLLNIT